MNGEAMKRSKRNTPPTPVPSSQQAEELAHLAAMAIEDLQARAADARTRAQAFHELALRLDGMVTLKMAQKAAAKPDVAAPPA